MYFEALHSMHLFQSQAMCEAIHIFLAVVPRLTLYVSFGGAMRPLRGKLISR